LAQSSANAYRGRKVLADITVTQMAANSNHMTAISGSNTNGGGTSQITTVGIEQALRTTALSGDFGDALVLAIIPPVAADGSFPDCYVIPTPDNKPLDGQQIFDASAPRNMMPLRTLTHNGRQVSLGRSLRDMVQRGANNLPLLSTGLKATESYQFRVISQAGWTNPLTPLRLILWGDRLTKAEVQELGARFPYRGHFQDQVVPFPAISGTHSIPGGRISPASWNYLSGGGNQNEWKINRVFRQSFNRVATPATGVFTLSNINAVGGAPGNVGTNPTEDLGFGPADGNRYLKVLELGIRPNDHQFGWGVQIDGTTIPGDSQDGLAVVTPNVNNFPYGNEQPQGSSSNRYYALPNPPFDVVAYNNKFSIVVKANGTPIPATDLTTPVVGVSVAMGGLEITHGGASQ